MATIIEAPNLLEQGNPNPSIFLAGGITGCPDWQSEVINLLSDTDLILFNPRRHKFPMGDSSAAEEQIKWEFSHLQQATGILFWFCKETINPIVLYELGFQLGKRAYSTSNNLPHIFIGMDTGYQRQQDVVVQSQLVLGNEFPIFSSLSDLTSLIRKKFAV